MTKAKSFHHAIVTRFNCARPPSVNSDREKALRSRPGWMEERFERYERYCLPTLLAQTDQDFEWLIYFDRHTSPEHLERARRGIASRPNFRVMLCDYYSSETLQADFVQDLPDFDGWLLTTRLDNDDSLHREYVERLHKEVRPGTREAINFPLGLVFGLGKTYLSRQESNAFISLSEPFANCQTVYSTPHPDWARVVPVRNVETDFPAWIQGVYEGAISNYKLRGKRLRHQQFIEGFETVDLGAGEESKESAVGVAVENLTLVVARDVRDRALRLLQQIRR
jgi:Putative rhamnosyl transferase